MKWPNQAMGRTATGCTFRPKPIEKVTVDLKGTNAARAVVEKEMEEKEGKDYLDMD